MEVALLIFMIAIGASVGSFLNVVIYRLPLGKSIVFPGSHCPQCGRAIHWYDNIPLVSWWVLGGKCRFCKCSISPRYLWVKQRYLWLSDGRLINNQEDTGWRYSRKRQAERADGAHPVGTVAEPE